MRRIAIVGSGVAGLLTAHGLVRAGYWVTLFSDRTPEQWLRECRPTGSAARFAPALAYERELGLSFWEEAPRIQGVLRAISERCGCLSLAFLGDMPVPQARAWLEE